MSQPHTSSPQPFPPLRAPPAARTPNTNDEPFRAGGADDLASMDAGRVQAGAGGDADGGGGGGG